MKGGKKKLVNELENLVKMKMFFKTKSNKVFYIISNERHFTILT